MPTDETVLVAISGTVHRSDRCGNCQGGMTYRVDEHGEPREMFCGHFGCAAWLQVEVPDAH